MNTPPAKAGGFALRLKAGSISHPADSDTSSISNMKHAQIQSEVSNKMAKTTLDTMKAEGAWILEMMKSAPKPSPISVKGSVVNTTA